MIKSPSIEYQRFYWVWAAMLQRCFNPTHKDYKHYGARGITVCPRWTSFENFHADMWPRPSRKHSLDRTDNERGYEPGNCMWVLKHAQVRNSRHCNYLTYNGITHCISEWAEITGINRLTINSRLADNWSVPDALTHPVRPLNRRDRVQ